MMSMRLLILSQYFPPEVGAPQNRLFELALRLRDKGISVTVLTAMPNYPQMEIQEAYRGKKYLREEMEGLTIHRSAIYVSQNKSILSRLRNYFSFVLSSARASARLEKEYDFLLCESPPLFLGYSAMYLTRKKKAKLIFNVSDLWPESAEKLGVVTNSVLLKLAYRLEERLYRKAVLVTGQTKGICANISARFPAVPTWWLPNGVDLQYYNPDTQSATNWRKENGFDATDFIVLYAGILGIAQKLEVILEAADQLRNFPAIHFVLMGSGPCKTELQELRKKMNLASVHFLDTVAKSEMPKVLKDVNAAVVPLRKLDLFLGAIPSKIFESLAMEKPLLLGVDGEARQLFIEEGKCGLFFEQENPTALAAACLRLFQQPEHCLELGKNGRQFVNLRFNRETIAADFYLELKKLANTDK
jgi:glycosyltransferase involved in cell wall biosynthesis